MSDSTSKLVPETPKQPDKASDTAGSGVEGSGTPPTVVSDHPNAPHPAVAGEPQTLGDYVIIRKIGEGGMGAVYLAEDTRLHRKAAIKMLLRELAANQVYRDRFEREARAAAAVEHDNIVPIWQVGQAADGSPYIAMPFLQGESLDARLARVPVAGVGLIMKVAREVASGLAAAHAKGLVHRDIKPANIWLEGDLTATAPVEQIRRCKILDFGLVRSIGNEDIQITTPGQSPGTPAFMSPEQAKGERIDQRSDLWSLGVTLYRMATGKLPFTGPHPMGVLIAITTETPTPVRELAPDLPPALADLIDRLMRRNPNGRPQSAAEVAATARQIAKDLQASETRVVPSPAPVAAEPPAAPLSLPAVAPAPDSISTSVPQLLATAEELTEPDDTPEPAVPEEVRRSRLPWAIAAAVGLLALVPLGLWLAGALRDKQPDPDAGAKKEEPPPATPPKDGPKNLDPDRAAAIYAQSVGACVFVNGAEQPLKATEKLPTEPFRLNSVVYLNNFQATDADLAAFAGCRHLTHLDLRGSKVTDKGLANLKECRNLAYLYLQDTQITSSGLAAFKDCDQLRELDLSSTAVDDAALAYVSRNTKLHSLWIKKTQVTAKGIADLAKSLPECKIEWDGGIINGPTDPDRKAATYVQSVRGCISINFQDENIQATEGLPKEPFKLTRVVCLADAPLTDEGLAAFAGCKDIRFLGLSGTPTGDAGLVHFKDCTELTYLYLQCPRVGPMGFAVLKNCTQLGELDLSYTQVDDTSLAHIKRFTKLAHLTLNKTKVTAAGVAELAKALPKCKIEWDGGVIEPKGDDPVAANADRKAAEWVLSVKGSVQVNGGGDAIKNAKSLPKDAFKLTDISLTTPVKDADLAVFAECKNLTGASLLGTKIMNAGLAHFKDCKNLTSLFLSGTKVDDGSVPVIKQFTKLTDLVVNATEITEKGVKEIANALPGCRIQWDMGTIEPATEADRKAAEYVLSVRGKVVINASGKDIADERDLPKDLFRLTYVDLGNKEKVTDAGLSVFADCKNLAELYLTNTPVGDEGLAHLKDCKSLLVLNLGGTKVSDVGLAHLKGCENLTRLVIGSLVGNSPISDAGFDHLKACKNLKVLLVFPNTKITKQGATDFGKLRPECRIELNAMTIQQGK